MEHQCDVLVSPHPPHPRPHPLTDTSLPLSSLSFVHPYAGIIGHGPEDKEPKIHGKDQLSKRPSRNQACDHKQTEGCGRAVRSAKLLQARDTI